MTDPLLQLGFSQADLLKLAGWEMPFGKYQNTALIDLPEEYLFWFHKHTFPSGELGRLMALCLELKIEGLDSLIKPLKQALGKEKIDDQENAHPSILIRELLAEEMQSFSRLVLESYSTLDGFPTKLEQPGYYKLLANLDKFAACSSVRFLGAFSLNNELSGGVIYFGDMKDYGSGGIAPGLECATGIRFLAVDSNAQGMGIGKLLSEACIQIAKDSEQSEVILHTIEVMEVAWKLYDSLGFIRAKELDFDENGLHIFGFRLILQEKSN